MSTLSAIRDGLQGVIDNITGLNVYDTWPGTVVVPAAIIKPPSAEYAQTFGNGNLTRYTFPILLLVQIGTLADAQDALDTYLTPTGASSIRAAIKADRTLGGVAHTAFVRGASQYSGKQVSDKELLGAEVEVEVWAE